MEAEVTKEKYEEAVAGSAARSRMAGENLRPAYLLSAMVVAMSAAVCAIGLRFPRIYGSNWGNGTAVGNDLVTLVAAVPLLALAVVYSARGSLRAGLLWLGALYYMVYNYAFYVFGISVTRLYVPLIAVWVLAGFAFALGMGNLDVEAIGRRFSRRTPGRLIAVYLGFSAVMVMFLWISQWVKFVLTGKVPEVNGSQSAYQVIAAVDLSLLVPMQITAAYLLWRRRAWGYVTGVVALVQGAIYLAVMAAVCVAGWILTPGSPLVSGWFINCVVNSTLCLVCLAALMLSVQKPGEAAQSWVARR
jgi:hypothetical protein